MTVFERDFASVFEAADKSLEPSVWGDNSSRENDSDFYGVSHTEAVRMVHEGWDEGRKQLSNIMSQAKASSSFAPLPSFVYDVAGSRPCPSRAAAGDPFCMRRKSKTGIRKHERIIRIAFSASYMASVDHGQIMRYGAALLSIVDALEAAGQRVELLAVFQSAMDGDTVRHNIVLKNAGDPVETDRLAFAMVHPSMSRRIVFQLRELEDTNIEYKRTSGRTVHKRPASVGDDAIWLEGVTVNPPNTIEDAFSTVMKQIEKNGLVGEVIVQGLNLQAGKRRT